MLQSVLGQPLPEPFSVAKVLLILPIRQGVTLLARPVTEASHTNNFPEEKNNLGEKRATARSIASTQSQQPSAEKKD
jgi:hypothetical protein